MLQTAFRFIHRMRVRWSEVDPQGVVFNARYLDYGDIGVTEYWRAVGFRFDVGDDMQFHVAHASVDYKKPIYPDEMIDLHVRTEKIGNTSMTVLVEIHGSGKDDLRSAIRCVQVHVDLDGHKPKPVPDSVRNRFMAFDAGQTIVRTGLIDG